MSNKEQFKKIDNFLSLMGERSIYGFLDISPSSCSTEEILSKYEAKYRHAQKNSKILKQEDWAIPTMRVLPLIKEVLTDGRKKKEYDEYCLHKARDEILYDFSRFTEKDNILHKGELDFIISSGEEKGVDESVILKWINGWAKGKVTIRDAEATDKTAEEILEEDFVVAVSVDKKLYPSTIRFLYKKGKSLGFNALTIAELVDEWAIKHKAEVKIVGKEKAGKPSDKTHYEVLGISRDADHEKIKGAYGEEFREYIHSRDKAEASVRFAPVKEAWECLRDPERKKKYDKQLKKKKEATVFLKGNPKIEIVNGDGREKKEFEFKNIRLWAAPSVSFIVKNGGGGILDASVRTSHPWLSVDADRVHQSRLPQKITITISPKKDKKKNYFGSKGRGFVEISLQKGSRTKAERIYVRFNVELPQRALRRFRLGTIPALAIIGGAIGLFGSVYLPSLQMIGQNLVLLGFAGRTLIAAGALFVIIYAIKKNIKKGLGVLLWTGILAAPLLGVAYALESIPHNLIIAISSALYLLPLGFFLLTKPLFRHAHKSKRNIMSYIWIVAIVAGLAAVASVFGEDISHLLSGFIN
ncbi:hypothetical protein B9J77_03825 [candidate division NPL-UPA2 bacterium Unc8]|uniref:J domain-containing protein n=1 Tax=candidate division NPL-UPA2 bacterium Unc8 TaxID=1980939 RepID=A0A399FUJ6_UNCN2|nr:MAG: hypothetical protein B9J77_03825 [candidate division NPL-UPA2 bacterium Unc8]